MMLGHVRDNLAYITLVLPGRDHPVNIEFLIDTGFEGYLILPSDAIPQLVTGYSSNELIRFADGTQSRRRTHEIEIDWNGDPATVYILELEGAVPLLGVGLLADHHLAIDVIDDGKVSIEPI